eukprot:12569016-Alexandrium_andersonii.AAC.1
MRTAQEGTATKQAATTLNHFLEERASDSLGPAIAGTSPVVNTLASRQPVASVCADWRIGGS